MKIERPNTLSGLVDKRREIAGKVGETRALLRQLIIDLDHVDAAIRLFDPTYDVEGLRPKLPQARGYAMKGDVTRAFLEILRKADGPMTTQELAKHLMTERGLDPKDVDLVQTMTRRAGPLLKNQLKRGVLRRTKDPKHGRFSFWEIAD